MPSRKIAEECEELFRSVSGINIHATMNMKFLKTPVGTDDFVEDELEKRLDILRKKVNSIAEMPFKMEAFTLLKACLSRCRVTHLMRTLPTQQIWKILENWDTILRGFLKRLSIADLMIDGGI